MGVDPVGLTALDAGNAGDDGVARARATSTRRARSDGLLMAPRSVEPGDPATEPEDPAPGTGTGPAAGAAPPAAAPDEDKGEPLLRADPPATSEVPDERAAPEGSWRAELAVGAGEPDEIWDNPKPDPASTAAAASTHGHGRPFLPTGPLTGPPAGPLTGPAAGRLPHGRREEAAPLARPPEAPTTPSSKRSRAARTAAALAPGGGSAPQPTRRDTACQRAHREAQSGQVAR